MIHKIAPYAIVGIALFVVVSTLVGDKSLSHLLYLRKELHQLEYSATNLAQDVETTSARISLAKSDPFFLERRAREELALSKPGEIIYIFREGSGGRPPTDDSPSTDSQSNDSQSNEPHRNKADTKN